MANKYDVIKTYGIEITAVTDKASEQINQLEKELDELSKKKGLSAGLQSQIDKIGETLNGLKGEIVSSTKSINDNLGKINTEKMSKEFKDMQSSIETSISGVQDKMKDLQASLDFLNDPNAGKGFASGIGKMFEDLSSTINGFTTQFANVSTVMQNIMDGSFDASSLRSSNKDLKNETSQITETLEKTTQQVKDSLKKMRDAMDDFTLDDLMSGGKDVGLGTEEAKTLSENIDHILKSIDRLKKANVDVNEIFNDEEIRTSEKALQGYRTELNKIIKERQADATRARKSKQDPTEVRFRYVIEDPTNTAINSIVNKIKNDVIEKVEKRLEGSPIRIPIGYTYDKSMFKDDVLAGDKALGKDTEKVLFDSINLKIKADASDLVNNINKEIENINAELKTNGKKIEVEVVGKIDESTVEQSAKELSEEIEHQQFVNQNEFNLKGGNLTIDPSSGIATETTLSDIKTILSEWNATGIPGTQSEEFKKSVEQEQKAIDNAYNVDQFLRTRKRGEVLQNKKDIIATTEYLVKSLERDQLIEKELKKLKSNKKLKAGDKSALTESAYFSEFTEVDGVKYAKFGKGETLEKWQENLLSLFKEGGLFPSEKEINDVKKKFKGYFQNEINRIDKSMKSTRESLALNGVEYAKENGKYTNRILYEKGTISSGDDNVYEKTKTATDIIKNDAIENLKHYHDVKQELIEQRQIMQEIVALSNKVNDGSFTEEDKNQLDYLKQDLQERTKIISDQKRYNELKEEETVLVNKNIEKGLNTTENKRLLEIRTEMDSLFKNASDDMVEYSKEQTRVIKNDLSSIDISINEITKKESALRRVTKDAINDILDDNFERIRSDSHYEYNKKEIEKLSEENSRLSKMISTKTDSYTGKTSYDYSAMTQAEKDKYWSNEKRLKFLRTQNHIYEEQRSIQEDTLEIAKKEEKVKINIANLNVPKKDKKAYEALFSDKSAKGITNDKDYIKSLSDDALKDAQNAVLQVQNAIKNSTKKSEEEIVQAAKKMIKGDIKALQELLKIRQESYDRHIKEKDFKAAKRDKKEIEKIGVSISSLQDPKSEVNASLLKEQTEYREKIYEYNHANYQLEEKVQALDEESKKKLKDILKINEAIAENERKIAKINSTQNVNDSVEEVARIEKERKIYEDKLKHLRDLSKSKGYDVGYDGYIKTDVISREEQEHLLKLYEEKEKSADRIFKIQARIHGMSEKAYRMQVGDSFSPLDSSEKNNIYESRLSKYVNDLSQNGKTEENTVNDMAKYIQDELKRRKKIKEQTEQIRQQEELITKEKEKQTSLSERVQKINIGKQYNPQIKEQETIIANEFGELEELNKKALELDNVIEQTKKKVEYATLKKSQEDIKARRKARVNEINLLKEELKYREKHLYDFRGKRADESDEEYDKVNQSKIELRQRANLEIQEKINSLQKEHNKELKKERIELAKIDNDRKTIQIQLPDVNDNENYSALLQTYELEKQVNKELIEQHKHRLNIAETTKESLENQKQSALNAIEERKKNKQLIADREKYNNLLKEEALSKKKTAFHSGMSEEQYVASYKVDAEIRNINSMQKELDKVEDKNSDAYKEIANNIELAKKRLSEFRKEAYDLGLKFSTKTGRMFNKKDTKMQGVSYTGTEGVDVTTPTSTKDQKKIANALVGITDEAKEAKNEINALNKVWRTANYTDTQADLVLEIAKVNAQLKSKTKRTKEETNALEEQLKVLHKKAKLEDIEINKNGYAKTLVSWKDINANPEQYATNKYIRQVIESPVATSEISTIGSDIPATEKTLVEIKNILSKKFGIVSEQSVKKQHEQKENGVFNTKGYQQVAKSLGLLQESKEGNFFVNKKDRDKVYSEMDKRGIARFLEEDTKATKKNIEAKKESKKAVDKDTEATEKNSKLKRERGKDFGDGAKDINSDIAIARKQLGRKNINDDTRNKWQTIFDAANAEGEKRGYQKNTQGFFVTEVISDETVKDTAQKVDFITSKIQQIRERIDELEHKRGRKSKTEIAELDELRNILPSVEQALSETQKELKQDGNQAGKEFGKAIEQGAKESLGINSPSTVFQEIAHWCGEGTKIGLDKEGKVIYGKVSDWKDKLLASLKDGKISMSDLISFKDSNIFDGRSSITKAVNEIIDNKLLPETKKKISKAIQSVLDIDIQKYVDAYSNAESYEQRQNVVKQLESRIKKGENSILNSTSTASAWEQKLPELKAVYDIIIDLQNEATQASIDYRNQFGSDLEFIITKLQEEQVEIGKVYDIQKSHDGLQYDVKGEYGNAKIKLDKEGNWNLTGKKTIEDTRTQVIALKKEISKLNGYKIDLLDTSDPAMFGAYANEVTKAQNALKELRAIEENGYSGQNFEELRKQLELVKKVSDELKGGLQVGESEDLGIIDKAKLDSVRQQLESLAHSTSKGAVEIGKFDNKNQELTYTMRTADNMLQTYTITMNKYNGQLKKTLVSEQKYLTGFQKALKGLGGKFQEIIRYTIASISIYEVFNFLKRGISVVQEMDAAMTELRKVSNDTEQALQSFRKESYEIANSIGSTGREIVNSAADWTKLGYSIKEASELAKNSALYANVGDMEIDVATEHMVSTLKAFNIEAKNSIDIVDKFNHVGNNYAITSAGIGEALERSASSLVAAGNDIDQAIALITAGNIVSQDAESVGNAIKVVSLRIRGSKTDLEEMGEETDNLASSTSKLRDELKSLTGVDIMLDDNTYKDTYTILLEISKVWDQLSDVSQANVLEKLAGKTRSSVVAGLLQQGETLEQVYKDSQNASGSALKENQKYMESIQGHLDILTNKWQKMWDSAINSNTVNMFIDFGSIVLDLVDKVGLLNSAIIATAGTFGAIKGIKGKGRVKMFTLYKYAFGEFSGDVYELCVA